jgi:hypothetical protein
MSERARVSEDLSVLRQQAPDETGYCGCDPKKRNATVNSPAPGAARTWTCQKCHKAIEPKQVNRPR